MASHRYWMPLFGKKKNEKITERPKAASSQNETSYFGKNLMIKGRVSGNGNVIILGGLDGEFQLGELAVTLGDAATGLG